MWDSNIQLGIDLATALSVVGASAAYIREVRRGRKIEVIEQEKERARRKNEFKLGKVSEIIEFLSGKEADFRFICERIDQKLHLVESPDDIDTLVVKMTKSERESLKSIALEEGFDFRYVPEEFMVAEDVKDILKLLRDVSGYLANNPYIRYLVDDKEIKSRVGRLVDLYEYHGTVSGKDKTDRKTLYMRVKDFESHPSALGGYIYAEVSKGANIVRAGDAVSRAKDNIENASRNITERESAKLLSRAYQEDFFSLTSANKKATVYRAFVNSRLSAMAKSRSEWVGILDDLRAAIKSLVEYTYETISRSE